MTRWPEIGSEAFETPLDSSIFSEDPSPEIKSGDMRDGILPRNSSPCLNMRLEESTTVRTYRLLSDFFRRQRDIGSEIGVRDMMEESDKVGDKRTRIIFSNDIGMREDGE